MIVCTRCGVANADDMRLCTGCGRKLQSLRGPVPEEGKEPEPPPLADESIDYRDLLGKEGLFRKHLEAWLGLGVLALALVLCLWHAALWPLAAALPVVALLAWLRKL